MKQIDPIRLLQEYASSRETHHTEIALVESGTSEYEIPLEPPAGARLQRLTIASTYRTPIPVFYDPSTRTTFPVSAKG